MHYSFIFRHFSFFPGVICAMTWRNVRVTNSSTTDELRFDMSISHRHGWASKGLTSSRRRGVGSLAVIGTIISHHL